MSNAYQPGSAALATKQATYIKDCGMLHKRYPFIPKKVIQQEYKQAKFNLREAVTALKKYTAADFPSEVPPAVPNNQAGFFAQAPPKLAGAPMVRPPPVASARSSARLSLILDAALLPPLPPPPGRLASLKARPLISTLPKIRPNVQPPPVVPMASSEVSPQRLAKPKKSINDKYNQSLPERLARLKAENGHVVGAPVKRRRLVRASTLSGDEGDDTIVSDGEAIEVEAPGPKNAFRLSDDEEEQAADSDSDPEAMYGDRRESAAARFETLEFLNGAAVRDVMELAAAPRGVVELLVAGRPYASLEDIEANTFTKETSRNSRTKTWGLKMVEKAATTLRGYAAVESLIRECAAYNAQIKRDIGKWGVTTHGADVRDGELEIVEIDVDTALGRPTPAPQLQPQLESDQEHQPQDGADSDSELEVGVRRVLAGKKYFKTKPRLLAEGVELKNYQQVGLNWLNLLYQHQLSCILADEMGLGKTCQVIAFMAHLKEADPTNCGRHLVVVPSSTLENWMREFRKFCPSLVVHAYYGLQAERFELREALADSEYDVLVTTYNLATGNKNDHAFLRSRGFNVVVYDEGHMLKNSALERYVKLMKLRARFRLLLTGTPLQNNLKELVSLLAFILPGLFDTKKEDLQGIFDQKTKTTDAHAGEHNPLLSQQAISKARTMMTPFVLRRRKDQVLKHLPQKTRETIYCELLPEQRAIYETQVNEAAKARAQREERRGLSAADAAKLNKTSPLPSSTNIIMQLRKASLHPLLFRIIYTEERLRTMAAAIMREPEYAEANEAYIFEDMEVMSDFELDRLCAKFPHTLSEFRLTEADYNASAGKVAKLREILPEIIADGHRILIFSLFTAVLDILERVLHSMGIKFLRLDGSTAVDERQDLIDEFYENDTIKVFLLSTKAGGFGINLVCANHVIIFDQSFNPHDDRQAEDRAHRVGQTSEVRVIRLITQGTIEENIFHMAENKLALDASVSEEKHEELAASRVEQMLFESLQPATGESPKQPESPAASPAASSSLSASGNP